MTAQLNLKAKYGEDFTRNFYLGQGADIPVSAVAKVDSSTIRLSADVLPAENDKVVLVGSDYYNNTYTATNVDTGSFDVAATFEINETKLSWAHALNLAGYTVEAKVWAAEDDAAAEISFTATVVVAAGGHVRITLTDTQVESLDIGTYYWDLFIINGSGVRERIFDGVFKVSGRGK